MASAAFSFCLGVASHAGWLLPLRVVAIDAVFDCGCKIHLEGSRASLAGLYEPELSAELEVRVGCVTLQLHHSGKVVLKAHSLRGQYMPAREDLGTALASVLPRIRWVGDATEADAPAVLASQADVEAASAALRRKNLISERWGISKGS